MQVLHRHRRRLSLKMATPRFWRNRITWMNSIGWNSLEKCSIAFSVTWMKCRISPTSVPKRVPQEAAVGHVSTRIWFICSSTETKPARYTQTEVVTKMSEGKEFLALKGSCSFLSSLLEHIEYTRKLQVLMSSATAIRKCSKLKHDFF